MMVVDLMMEVGLMMVIVGIKNSTNVFFNFFDETNVIIMSRHLSDKNHMHK